MNLLISDYEGALKKYHMRGNMLLYREFFKDIKEIKKFIKNGNLVVLYSKKNFDSFMKDMEIYNINYNYLIIDNGLVCLDKDKNILFGNYINEKLLKVIDSLSEKNLIFNIKKYNEFGLTNDNDNIIKIKAQVINYKKFYEIATILRNFNIKISFPDKENCFYISKDVDKSMVLDYLINSLNVPIENVYVFGNSYDVFDTNCVNIYCVNNSVLKNHNFKEVKNIKQLIKKIK